MTVTDKFFLGKTRLMSGPWQAFERDTARLFLAHGFEDVRVVGGTGDKGGDVLAVKDGKTWVIQCKHTTTSGPKLSAIKEVIQAGEFYGADELLIAASRGESAGFRSRLNQQRAVGLSLEIAGPRRLLEWMENAKEYPPAARELRPYQRQASERLRESLVDTGRGQLVLATGLGKTVIMAETVADLLRDELIEDGRVLVLAHTRPLVNQLLQAFWYQLPKWVATHRLGDGETPSYWDGITFATIQSVANRIDELPRFGLVLVDEAHHIGATGWFQDTIDGLKPKMLAGVTATPWRGDGYDIDRILGPPLVQIGIAEGLREGFLSEVDYRLLADNVDWNFVQSASKHSYSLSQLNKRLILPTRDDKAAQMIVNVFREEKRASGIVYCPSGVHAKTFSATLRQFGLRAEAILHDTRARDRDSLMSRFRAGELDIVTTVDLFNEGVDVPDVDLIAFMRVTHSRRIFVQQLGRGLRVSQNKDRVIVLDFVTDLRRVAEVVKLDRDTSSGDEVERLGLGSSVVSFGDQSAGSFLKDWMLDQASLLLRENDPKLEIPTTFDFPDPGAAGGVQ